MIKVKEVESHDSLLVAKGKLVLVPCQEATRLGFRNSIIISETEQQDSLVPNESHVLFTSQSGDRMILKYTGMSYGLCGVDIDTNTPYVVTLSQCAIILALPEHFSPKQLQAIADGELKNGDDVYVECKTICVQTGINCGYPCNGDCTKTGQTVIKLSNGHITLPSPLHIQSIGRMNRKESIPIITYIESASLDDTTRNKLQKFASNAAEQQRDEDAFKKWFEDHHVKAFDLFDVWKGGMEYQKIKSKEQ